MKLKKAWVIFLLVLIISVQLVVLSSFHNIDANGTTNGNSVIAVWKWNYVQGSVHISIMPIIPPYNETSHVDVVLPNGTSINLVATFSSYSPYSFNLQLPRTGDYFGSGAISGPLSLSQSQPMNATVSQNVGNVADYVRYLNEASSGSFIPIDVYTVVVYGQAQVSISGYGIAL